MFKTILPAFLVFIHCCLFAQSNLIPAKLYSAGDELYGVRAGAKTIVPKGWSGRLPRDSEIFLLLPNTGAGQIYVTGDDILNKELRKSNWQRGMSLGNGNFLKSDGNIFKRGKSMASNVVLKQKTSNMKGYIESTCGPFGRCISATLFALPEDFERMKQALYIFMDSLSWVEPNLVGKYDYFNWHEQLSGKHLLNYDYVPNAKSENDLWLCSDGTFSSKVKRGGQLKNQAKKYKGKHRGTWHTSSIGKEGMLVLKFEKLPVLELPLRIEDDRIFLNNRRHFAINAKDCK